MEIPGWMHKDTHRMLVKDRHKNAFSARGIKPFHLQGEHVSAPIDCHGVRRREQRVRRVRCQERRHDGCQRAPCGGDELHGWVAIGHPEHTLPVCGLHRLRQCFMDQVIHCAHMAACRCGLSLTLSFLQNVQCTILDREELAQPYPADSAWR